jgi:hypothetical protein
MGFSDPAHILVVAHETAASPALLDAIRERVQRGPTFFHLVVPNPASADWHPPRQERTRRKMSAGELVLAEALPLIEAAARRPTDGSVSIRHDPMDAIEETLYKGDFDEIILSTPAPARVSRWLHVDLPRRVAHLGLPLTTVIVGQREPASVSSASASSQAPFRWAHR